MPAVSVVIPCYNHAEYLGEAIDSVLGQTHQELELIVVDNGSTDASLSVARSYTDPRVKVLTQCPNRGAHWAINQGLAEATAPYLSILNSDDIYHPERLERVVGQLESKKGPALVGTYLQVIDSSSLPLGNTPKRGPETLPPWKLEHPERSFRRDPDLRVALLTENYWATSSNFAFSREAYEMVGEFRALRFTHDWDFALRLSELGSLHLLPEVLLQYRIHPENTIRKDPVGMIFEILWCQCVHLPRQVKTEWFETEEPSIRVDQMLHSLYSFGVERALSTMMSLNLAFDEEAAMKLLEPDDPVRIRFLSYIGDNLPHEHWWQRLEEALRSLFRSLKTKFPGVTSWY
jgi:glycosyltransferase involved in cell wall biosynthesis